MKKIFILFAIIILFLGCEFTDSTVPNATVQKALDIAHEQSKDLKRCPSEACYAASYFLSNPTWNFNMNCKVLDNSDVQGKKSIRGCLLKNSILVIPEVNEYDNKNVLVFAQYVPSNRDIVLLEFHTNAEETKAGFSFSRYAHDKIAVNLKTQKIGTL